MGEDVAALIDSVPRWFHQIEVAPGVLTPGSHESAAVLEGLPIPNDVRGLRVLDLGTRDGFFAFEMERRGAEVVAVDYMPVEQTGFAVAKRLLGSGVEYVNANVYDLSPQHFGEFDLVLFLGLLYHLRDPMLALDRIWSVCRGRVIIETQVIDEALLTGTGQFVKLASLDKRLTDIPLMQFYPGATLHNDHTNWWAPNLACLRSMLETSGFSLEHVSHDDDRAVALARKTADEQVLYHRVIEKASNVVDGWESFTRERESRARGTGGG